jgi:ATP-dependent RNA helicase SrmB
MSSDAWHDIAGLDPRLLRTVGKLSLERPTEVQEEVIGPALEGRDLLVCAPTGSGKTLAYLLPMLQRLLETHGAKGGPRGLILTPTRELADQVWRVIRDISDQTTLRYAQVTGGVPYEAQLAHLQQHEPDLIVATPGRLLAHLSAGKITLFDLEVCIIDEADRMLDLGFLPDVGRILSQSPRDRQLLMLSATLEQEAILELAHEWLRDPEVVEVGGPRALAPGVSQRAFLADDARHKLALLRRLLEEVIAEDPRGDGGAAGKALVFSVSKIRVESLAAQLKSSGLLCEALHGGLALKTRLHRVHQLNDGRIRVLVATDVAARGLDIARVTHVFNYDLPRSADVYVHRAGRTARAGESGEIVSLVEAHDARMLQRVERYLAHAVPRQTLPGLEPQHREPIFKRKKRKKNKLRDGPPTPPKKQRWRDRKNKGKPKGPLSRTKKQALRARGVPQEGPEKS